MVFRKLLISNRKWDVSRITPAFLVLTLPRLFCLCFCLRGCFCLSLSRCLLFLAPCHLTLISIFLAGSVSVCLFASLFLPLRLWLSLPVGVSLCTCVAVRSFFEQIALNGWDDYTGGGTFFPSLNRSLRPPKGHALSFRGDILHGGDPLLSGVRYIIACFCYYDDDTSTDDDARTGDFVNADGKRSEGDLGGGGQKGTDKAGLDGLRPRRSGIGSGVSVGDGKSGDSSHVHGDGEPGGDTVGTGGGKGGIEFRSDKAFSFGFGFG